MNQLRRGTVRVDWLGVWILFSAWCPITGWVLSMLGCLNLMGVAGSGLLFAVALGLLWKPLVLVEFMPSRKWYWVRTRKLLPRVWLIFATLVLVGGLAYVPNNYDYLSYRFPRLLNWCWEQKWFWISTVNMRMNYSGTLFEWMMAPSFILFRTDRLFFAINFVSYLFLPQLIYSVFRSLGISARISWWWMWVLPTGYCYILEAASVCNDSFAAVYLLASLHYLYRAKVEASNKNIILSTLAIALMTGAKTSNLPLVLPWLMLVFFLRERVFVKITPVLLAVLLMVSAVVSFLPLALLNRHYTGDFFGDPDNRTLMKVANPIVGIVGNTLEIGLDNLAPPFWYKALSLKVSWPPVVQAMVDHSYPRWGVGSREFPVEDGAGIGLGCVVGAAVFVGVSVRQRRLNKPIAIVRNQQSTWVVYCIWIAILVYMAKIGSEAAPRLIAPYYPLLIAGLLVYAAPDGRATNRRLIRYSALAIMLSALPMLVFSPARPLFPIGVVSRVLDNCGSEKMRQRFDDVYPLFAQRAFAFQEVMPLIPPTETQIGFLQNGNALEASLWRPFGKRRVVKVGMNDSAADIKARGIHWVVVSGDALSMSIHADIAAVLAKWSGQLVAEKHFAMMAQKGPETWYVVFLGPTN